MNSFNSAVNTKVVGNFGGVKAYEMRFLPDLIERLKKIKKYNKYENKYFIEYLPINFVADYTRGLTFKNENNWICKLEKVQVKHNRILATVSSSSCRKNTWSMWLTTLCEVLHDSNYPKLKEKWLVRVTPRTIDSLIERLENKVKTYNDAYETSQKNASDVIANTVKSKTSDIVVTRQAIRKSILSIQHDQKLVASAFNSTLTESEKNELLDYLKKNVYSLRLYVVKNSQWDKAITELYPDEQFGKKRRTEASELSKNSIGGYISLISDVGAPLDIIQKITHKADKTASLVKNSGSNKYRLNNYLLVLFLLQNYNDIGFVTAKTNLYKSITA